VHLLFNIAGIGGSGSFINTPRAEWEKTFAVSWYGVYYSTRAFLPLLMKATSPNLVNMKLGQGLLGLAGPTRPHTRVQHRQVRR